MAIGRKVLCTALSTITRGYATAAKAATHEPSKLRNMALVAHIDSGKTTLTESILLSSSYISTSGSVDTGSTTTDFLPAERERGITIQSASIPVKWKDWTFNLIDTPGHADFGMEVESASRVIDGAVVLIDSVEGVESQTKGVWKQLDRYNVGSRIVFLNKLDRPGASFRSSLRSLLSHRFHPQPMPLALPIASFDQLAYSQAEPGIQGLVDLVNWEVWKWDEEGGSSCCPLPPDPGADSAEFLPSNHPVAPLLLPARTQLLENLSMHSEELMEHLLELPPGSSSYGEVKPSMIMPHLRAATIRNDVLPVLCGAAAKHIGTELVMNYVGELLPSPLDVKHDHQVAKSSVRMLAWKVSWDKRKGWMTFVRVYSGTLKRGDSLYNVNQHSRERVSKLLLLYASQSEEVDQLPFGSVGVILGFQHTRTGDTLVSYDKAKSETSSLAAIIPPPAVISASVTPTSFSDLAPVQTALQQLSRTDPSVRLDLDNQDGQILVHGLGSLHLEIVERRLRDEWGVQFEFGKRRVSYREGLGPGLDPLQLESDTWSPAGANPVTIGLHLKLRALEPEEIGDPAWDGNIVVNSAGVPLQSSGNTSDHSSVYIGQGLASTLLNSPHTTLPLTKVHIEVAGYDIPANAPPSLLTGASAAILRQRIRKAGPGPVMEPYVALKISVDENSLGKVVKDLTENGGEVHDLGGTNEDELGGYPEDGVYLGAAWLSPSGTPSHEGGKQPQLKRVVRAVAPLSRLLDYSKRLRALSGGHGTFELTNAGFQEVSDARRLEILTEIGRA
ncbi:hypothetical protein HGRIS_009491 [Hohenbuehelia grisea]|uniref:Tr-type G domain-containing protein n=1 Tax=Hohenbuehelia grisea TaxID=104357 RepID=A0ABR3J1K4_9AGAR